MSISNMGVIVNAGITTIASLAIATIATLATLEIAAKQYKIARRQLKLAQARWNRFKTTYTPVESKVAAQLWAEREYSPNYGMTASMYAMYARVGLGQFNVEFNSLSLCDPQDYAKMLASYTGETLVDVINFAYRVEETKRETLSDVLFNRRAQFLNLGRDCAALSARYAAGALALYDSVRDKANSLARDAGEFTGRKIEEGRSTEAARSQQLKGAMTPAAGSTASASGLFSATAATSINDGTPIGRSSGLEVTNFAPIPGNESRLATVNGKDSIDVDANEN